MMEVITSNKGGQKLIFNGFIYTKQITKPRNIRWRCVQRTTDCKATLTTTLDLDVPKLVTAHNHDPSDTKVAAVKCRSEMKQQAKQSFDKPSQIMTQAMSQIDVAARVDLGMEESIKRTLRNQRLGRIPPQPESLQDLVIDGEWALTTGPDPQQFLIYDNGPDTDSRIIVFGASDALQHLSRADTWFMDGNHAVAPTLYAKLQRKSQETYENLLHAIVDKCSELHQDPDPTTVVIDFEMAMVRAVSSVLGDQVTVQGCFYHLTQSTWRKVQDLGLTQRYKDSEDVKLFCGMMHSLALLPIDDLPAGLEFLRHNTPEGMEPLLNYFDATYCTGTYRRIQRHAPDGDGQDAIMLRHIAPLFPPQIWNVHQVTIDGEQRTNNLCEAWNHRIEHLCGVSHPSVWKLIHWLKADSAHVSTILLNAARKRVKRVYTQLQSRLHQLCVDRRDGNKTVEEFLRGAGHNIRWKPHGNQNQVVE